MFQFSGDIILSKSWLNRAQVVKYYNSGVQLPQLESSNLIWSDDVHVLKKSIDQITHTDRFNLGQGGTSFRFFVFLMSRLTGEFFIGAHQRLLDRPQAPLIEVLEQLGVKSEIHQNYLKIKSSGWQYQSEIQCKANLSSQFLSGLILSCWNLPEDIQVVVPLPIMSYDYLKMTLDLVALYGMQFDIEKSETQIKINIKKNQKANQFNLQPELDVSSLFSLAAAAVVNGQIEVKNWQNNSIQPDFIFLDAFRKMNIQFEADDSEFKIKKHNTWNGLDINLQNSPDLFPVLAVMCAMAQGDSKLYGATQLKLKESDRIKKTSELLKLCGYKCEELVDGLCIKGQSTQHNLKDEIIFNPDHDHRMAMAAALFKLKGFNIKILQPEVVDKSYPQFWKDIGL